ncbi:MAG: hypothetical protein AAF639_47705 [Chloroflexota bacterium]
MISIRTLTDGRQLPGYHWTPIRVRLQRQKRIRRIAFWTGMVALAVLVSLVAGVFLMRVDANSYWAQVFAAVGALIGMVSGVTTVMGWVLRYPKE